MKEFPEIPPNQDLEQGEERELSALSADSFREHLEGMEEYRMLDSITRKNFTSILVRSFALSRGIPFIQKAFFELLRVKNDFNWKETLKNLNEAGGFDALSEEEREYFLNAFMAVRRHAEKFEPFEFEDEVKNEIEHIGTDDWQIDTPTSEVKSDNMFRVICEEQKQKDFSTFEEYVAFLAPKIAEFRASAK